METNLDKIFHALADSSRREIVDLLQEAGKLRVGDIAVSFSMSLNAVSKHIKVLEKSGLVIREVEGREHFILINKPGMEIAFQWIHHRYRFWEKRLEALASIDFSKGDNNE